MKKAKFHIPNLNMKRKRSTPSMTSLSFHMVTRIIKNKNLLLRLTVFLLFFITFYKFITSGKGQASTYIPPEKPLDPVYAKLFHDLNPVVSGWGEDGGAVVLSEEEEKLSKETFSKAAFNVYASDRIRFVSFCFF